MKHRRVRVVLAVVVVLAAIGGGIHVFRTARQIARLQASADRFNDLARKALDEADRVRAGQRAYVAPGQGLSFWTSRIALTLTALRADLTALHNATTIHESRLAVESALSAEQELADMNARILEGLRIGDRLTIADTIFSEGEQASANLTRHLELARSQQLADINQQIYTLARRQWIIVGSAGLLLILSLIALVPVDEPRKTAEQPLPLVPSGNEEPSTAGETPSEFGELRITPAAPEPGAPEAAVVDFEAAAALCNEIARLESPAGLPMLLERAAALLDASGVVLWAVTGGTELTAALTYGYSPETIARIPTIASDANNVTAVAFRTGQLQYASGDMVARGALAAPLVAPGGCVGVFTAEMRNSGERQPARRALASIIASQLATVLGTVGG